MRGLLAYLPRLDSQTDEEYAAYKERAAFFNATARTAEGYVGLIFRRPPFIKTPEDGGLGSALSEFVNDADMLGTPLVGNAKNVVGEVISVGRAGTLIDWESEVENRVYVSRYAAENILNWRVERINGWSITTMVALLERGVRNAERGMKGDDPFVEEVTEQIRVLRLVADDARPHPSHDGSVLTPRLRPQPRGEGETFSASRRSGSRRDYSCVVEIWQQEEKKGKRDKQEWKLVETRIPLRLGKPLPLIPFVFHGPNHAQPGVEKLPMADIIAVNLDHYRLDADYKHGVHFAARTDSLGVLWQVGHVVDRVKRRWVTATFGAAAGHL